jgi:hypothetical protein
MTTVPLSPFGRVDWPEPVAAAPAGDRRPVRRPRVTAPWGLR